LLSSPVKSREIIDITPTTTLQDIIAATIQPDHSSTSHQSTYSPTTADDDETLAAAIWLGTQTLRSHWFKLFVNCFHAFSLPRK
jgi:hypothetical protein